MTTFFCENTIKPRFSGQCEIKKKPEKEGSCCLRFWLETLSEVGGWKAIENEIQAILL